MGIPALCPAAMRMGLLEGKLISLVRFALSGLGDIKGLIGALNGIGFLYRKGK